MGRSKTTHGSDFSRRIFVNLSIEMEGGKWVSATPRKTRQLEMKR
jgi:hypothetical protein